MRFSGTPCQIESRPLEPKSDWPCAAALRGTRADHVLAHGLDVEWIDAVRNRGVRQHDVSHVVVLRTERDARRVLALLHVAHYLKKELPNRHRLRVAGAQMLVLAVRDRAHGLGHGRVL